MDDRQAITPQTGSGDRWLSERARLVGLCARLTGNLDVAEDLAQETLLEAWYHSNELREASKRSQWLSGIARNVCLMWARKQARESARVMELLSPVDRKPLDIDDLAIDELDLEVELERDELAELLDRAMGLLPDETRAVLIERYIEESPYAEIAARMGLTEAQVDKQLRRGKLALRRAVTTDLKQEAAAYGLSMGDTGDWRETRIWCPVCGRRRLWGLFNESQFTLRCQACFPGTDVSFAHTDALDLLAGLKGYKPAYNRMMEWLHTHVTPALSQRAMPCGACRRLVPLHLGPSKLVPYHITMICDTCGEHDSTSLAGLVLSLPEGRRFWREHPRIRKLPERELEADGCSAVVSSFESVTGSARFDVVSRLDTYEVLSVHTSPGPVRKPG